jgi:hypothetical protein
VAGSSGAVSKENKPAPPWLLLDPQTGALTGTPPAPGVSVFLIAANAPDGQTVLCDAKWVIVTVTE